MKREVFWCVADKKGVVKNSTDSTEHPEILYTKKDAQDKCYIPFGERICRCEVKIVD